MAIKTDAEIRRESPGKSVSFTNATSFPFDVWVPPSGKSVSINDVVLAVIQKTANSFVVIIAQVFINGIWRNFYPLGTGQEANTIVHDFGGRIQTDIGDGTAPRIRLIKSGPSGDFEGLIAITGREM